MIIGITWLFRRWQIYWWILLVFGSSEIMLAEILVSVAAV